MQNSTNYTVPWQSRELNSAAVPRLMSELGISSLLAKVLAARGFTDPQSAQAFLASSLETEHFAVENITNLRPIAEVLSEAIDCEARILVFGDFDVDGVTATALLFLALQQLGAMVDWIIPSRFDEGYGLTEQVIPRVLEREPDIVVTVDCGIASGLEIDTLAEQGIEVLVTDHHEPTADLLPKNCLIADPKQFASDFGQNLAGAGVALALVKVLGELRGHGELWCDFLDLATLGTVADIMPLTGFNRALVRAGLELINTNPRPGIAALAALQRSNSNAPGAGLTAIDLSYGMIPRLNASGRLGDASDALLTLISDDDNTAHQLAETLSIANDQRRSLEAELSALAIAQAEASYQPGDKLVVVAGDGWHEGIRGIVASRISRNFGVPAIVFTIVDSEARGSGRSVGQVHMHAALQAVAEHTVRFGGHESAVGVTVLSEKLQDFTDALAKYLADQPEELFHPVVQVDALLPLSNLSWEAVSQLQQLEPFGQSNPQPQFVSQPLRLSKQRTVGASNNHLSFSVNDSTAELPAIWFNCESIEQMMTETGLVQLAFQPLAEYFRGSRSLQLRVTEAFEPSENLTYATAFPELVSGLYPSQVEALDYLEQGKSVLVLMPTGRGKSLIFQLHAAKMALQKQRVSILVYPLRALINDQQRHLQDRFSTLGIESQILCGQNSLEEREAVYASLASGKTAVILSTPEFLMLYADRIKSVAEVGFLAFDEAHHIASDALFRPAYQQLGQLTQAFSGVQVLAATATASDEHAAIIESALGLDCRVIDRARRPNLIVCDARDSDDKLAEVVKVALREEPCIIYTYSRDSARFLVRDLRKALPQMATRICFYHAGLDRALRQQLENDFQAGVLSCLVTTSAFGEGVNIANIRDLVMYHPPFSRESLNQLAGRAGRDGADARIHLLFSRDDLAQNRTLLSDRLPSRESLAGLYRYLKALERDAIDIVFSDESLAAALNSAAGKQGSSEQVSASQVDLGLSVFLELGLIEVQKGGASSAGAQSAGAQRVGAQRVGARTAGAQSAGAQRVIRLCGNDKKVELNTSSLYLEAYTELSQFDAFSDWLVDASVTELEQLIQGAILPVAD